MSFHPRSSFPRALAATLLVLGTGAALAQQGKPAAQPQGRTSSLGNAAADAPILTRDQLRQCLTRRDELAARRDALQRERDDLDKQRAALQQDGEALKTERAGVDRMQAQINELNERSRAFSVRAEAYKQRVAQAQAAGSVSPETVKTLETERLSLNEEAGKLQAEQNALAKQSEGVVKAYNERAQARDAKVGEWNEANRQQLARVEDHELANAEWKDQCGNRRYREDDEKAIKAGK